MKKLPYLALILVFYACKNKATSEVKMADSANHAAHDTALNHKSVVIDEASTAFLVRAFDENAHQLHVANVARETALFPDIKAFADTIYQTHVSLRDSMQMMATQKSITLPSGSSDEAEATIDNLLKKRGHDFDKAFINFVREEYNTAINRFQEATTDTRDFDVRAFADRSLTQMTEHLKTAKQLHDKYW